MAAVGPRDTRPELVVRRILHGLGYRFRLHRKDLPGRPDIVLPRYGTAIFVHGCFWHRHPRCRKTTTPKTNRDFWQEKFRANRRRDRRNVRDLQRQGWHVIVVWECETQHPDVLADRLNHELQEAESRT